VRGNCNGDGSSKVDYVAGIEVADLSNLPREFARVRIPEQRYAVFTHAEHISTIRSTVNTIWNHWLPASGMKAADAPNFEHYDENTIRPQAMAGWRSGCRRGSDRLASNRNPWFSHVLRNTV